MRNGWWRGHGAPGRALHARGAPEAQRARMSHRFGPLGARHALLQTRHTEPDSHWERLRALNLKAPQDQCQLPPSLPHAISLSRARACSLSRTMQKYNAEPRNCWSTVQELFAHCSSTV